jgi:fucose 4-O-acetylase-like acetyltransferase
MERDKQLDIYRSLLMIYIVCYIHGILYWMKYGVEPIQSYSLIEMPLIFFVSGAAFRLSRPKSAISAVKSRVNRVIFPWYIYSVVSLVILTLFSSLHLYGSFSYSLRDILKVLLTIDIPHAPLMFHNWFILPYMFISCSWCCQQYLINKFDIRGGTC